MAANRRGVFASAGARQDRFAGGVGAAQTAQTGDGDGDGP